MTKTRQNIRVPSHCKATAVKMCRALMDGSDRDTIENNGEQILIFVTAHSGAVEYNFSPMGPDWIDLSNGKRIDDLEDTDFQWFAELVQTNNQEV